MVVRNVRPGPSNRPVVCWVQVGSRVTRRVPVGREGGRGREVVRVVVGGEVMMVGKVWGTRSCQMVRGSGGGVGGRPGGMPVLGVGSSPIVLAVLRGGI